MFEDDALSRRPKPEARLETLSIEELSARVERLKSEIAACEAAIAEKRSHQQAAASVFRTKSP
jgi:uncharacterized small protein (DUF1192 family)